MPYSNEEKPFYEQTTVSDFPPAQVVPAGMLRDDASVPTWPPPPRPRPSQGPSRRARILALILTTVLVLGALTLLIYSATSQYSRALGAQDGSDATAAARNRQQQQATLAVQQSATAHPLATLQAQILATATAQAQPAATASAAAAQSTATGQNMVAELTKTTSGTATLTDPMSDNSQGHVWDVGYSDNNNTGCNFVNGSYQVLEAYQGFLNPCFADATNFDNFTYQISMIIGSNCSGGLLLRGNKSTSQYYLFLVGADGSYQFEIYNKNKYTQLASGTSSAILSGAGQTNSLAVIANRGVFDLFVNQTYVAEAVDNQLSSGQIGVVAYNTSLPASVTFSNAEVWKM